MKKLFDKMAARLRQPKWRHGKLGALLMVCFLGTCVLLNVAVKALEDEYGWRTDLSFNGYATTTEQTQAALDSLAHGVELYLLYNSGAEDAQVLEVLNRYAVLSDSITVLPTDLARNPGIVTRFPGDTETVAEADTVIVNCPDTGRYELINPMDFVTLSYNIDLGSFEIEGLAYEKLLTEAIVRVSQDELPTIGLLAGHGELDMESLTPLVSLLRSNAYEVAEVNLSTGGSLENVDMLMIASPQKDLSDAEIEQINAFLTQGHSLFITRDYTDTLNMPNYLSLLRSYGVVPLSGVVVASEEDTGSYDGELLYLVPYMQDLDITSALIENRTDLLLLPGATAFETPGEADQSLTTAAVLKSGPHAYLRDLSDGETAIDKQPGDREGELTLALFAHRMHATGEISRAFAIGNSLAFVADYVYQRAYTEEFVLTMMRQLVPDKAVSLDIMASTALRPALTVGSQPMSIALIVALPLVIIVAALMVLLPRRNR